MAEQLADLGVIDIRDQLPRAAWSIGTRAATTSLTWHYNGPPVPVDRQIGAGLIAQLQADAAWQRRPGWGGTIDGADGLMYHLVFAADGVVYQTRDLDDLLWHCAHQDGNAHGLALHVPIGVGQAPTAPQLASLFRMSQYLRTRFAIPLTRVLGHLEWKHATACPGPQLMQALSGYRTGLRPLIIPTVVPPTLRRWRVRADLGTTARVRQGPGQSFPIAGRFKPDTLVYVDVVQQGQRINGVADWVHMAKVPHEQADLGFLWAGLGTWVSA